MAERLTQPTPESFSKQEVAEAAGEQLKKLERTTEAHHEVSQEKAVEQARKQVEQEALFTEEQGSERHGNQEPTSGPAMVGKKQKQVEYEKTLKEVRSQISAPARIFSQIIHNPTVEKVSDVTGNTIARPNAVLAGSLTAFIVVLSLYLAASYYGYRLSGFELIGSFALGWILGILIDILRTIFKRRRLS